MAGDEGNFISRYARLHGKAVHEALEDVVERLTLRDQTVRAILGDGKARDAWDSFTAGFIKFHIITPRYKLRDVIPEFY